MIDSSFGSHFESLHMWRKENETKIKLTYTQWMNMKWTQKNTKTHWGPLNRVRAHLYILSSYAKPNEKSKKKEKKNDDRNWVKCYFAVKTVCDSWQSPRITFHKKKNLKNFLLCATNLSHSSSWYTLETYIRLCVDN